VSIRSSVVFHAVALAALVLLGGAPVSAQRRTPKDLSTIRGFNYQSAPTTGHAQHWLQYSAAETERDLDFAQRLQLNQARVLIPFSAWAQDKEAFRKNLLHLVRAAHQRGIGVMPTLQYAPGVSMNKNRWPESREFVADLIATIGKEPGLAFWDVSNEPDCCALPPTPANRTRMEHAVYMAKMFHELDPVTPVTIGAAFSDNMIEMGDAQDVLSFHNYLPTRAAIRADIAKAKAYAARVGKPLIDTEIGCIARANPYDVTLEEHMKANVGWYIWELMITHQWGNVHGVFHPDGTIRDPAIVAALFGMFRDRDENVIPGVPDREGAVTRAVAGNRKWLADTNAGWEAGLDLAEISANLLEAGQLIAMYDPPTRTVDLLRKGAPNMAALRAAIEKYTAILEPHQLPEGDARRARPPATQH
jgi:hypothetical protein